MRFLKRILFVLVGLALLFGYGCATKSGGEDNVNSRLQNAPVMKPGENQYKRPKS